MKKIQDEIFKDGEDMFDIDLVFDEGEILPEDNKTIVEYFTASISVNNILVRRKYIYKIVKSYRLPFDDNVLNIKNKDESSYNNDNRYTPIASTLGAAIALLVKRPDLFFVNGGKPPSGIAIAETVYNNEKLLWPHLKYEINSMPHNAESLAKHINDNLNRLQDSELNKVQDRYRKVIKTPPK